MSAREPTSLRPGGADVPRRRWRASGARVVAAGALIASLGVARSAAARPAGSADDRARAETLAADAKVHFDLGEWAEAITGYEDAYRLYPSPGLLYNLGQAYRLAGDCARAVTTYKSYLRQAPDSSHRAVVEQHLAELGDCTAAAGAHAPGDAGDAADGGDDAGAARGRRRPSDAPAEPGGPLATDAGAVATPLPGVTAPRRRAAGPVVIGLGAGGVVALAAGVYFAIDASQAADEVSRFYQDGGAWADIADVDARGRRSRALAIGLLGGGVALGAGATALYLWGGRDEPRAAAVTLVPSPDGARVAVWGRF
ncbi:MAG: tetratricopeptide repeat protein [Kofleriaceae bacterium]|nr:tetratricopeptide repeat protein [Kofleriaceae bacterium]